MTISPTTRHRGARHSLWVLMLASLAAPAHAQDNWPAWGGDLGNQRHSPLTYMGKDGKQYVAVAAGTMLLTYTLP